MPWEFATIKLVPDDGTAASEQLLENQIAHGV
jgi:hypothetical protein